MPSKIHNSTHLRLETSNLTHIDNQGLVTRQINGQASSTHDEQRLTEEARTHNFQQLVKLEEIIVRDAAFLKRLAPRFPQHFLDGFSERQDVRTLLLVLAARRQNVLCDFGNDELHQVDSETTTHSYKTHTQTQHAT